VHVVGYIRVSTDGQADHGLGLQIQERAVRQWARAEGHRLVGVLSDKGVSGTKDAADRPGLTAALAMIEDRGAEGLLVARLDRLARTLVVQEAVLGHVWKHGGRVYAVDVGEVLQDDPDDPMRTAMRQMMGVFSQLERGMIAARLRSGRARKHENGGYAYGAPAYGFRAEKKSLVVDEREQAALALMAELRGAGASLNQIAPSLERNGYMPRRAIRWQLGTLGPIVARLEVAA
jgi:DNA invertase Pin-like site-specific DNA recombinase